MSGRDGDERSARADDPRPMAASASARATCAGPEEQEEAREAERREEVRAAEEVEEEQATYSPERNRLQNVFLLFAALWRLLRGDDRRGRKVRWLLGLLRPYRGRVALMFVALLVATAAGLAPPYLAGKAIDAGIHPRGRARRST